MKLIDFCCKFLNENAPIVCVYKGAVIFKGKVQDFPFDDCVLTVDKVESFDKKQIVLLVH